MTHGDELKQFERRLALGKEWPFTRWLSTDNQDMLLTLIADQRLLKARCLLLEHALCEALAECLGHNAEYQHVTPKDQLRKWQALLAEAKL